LPDFLRFHAPLGTVTENEMINGVQRFRLPQEDEAVQEKPAKSEREVDPIEKFETHSKSWFSSPCWRMPNGQRGAIVKLRAVAR
jgi:hypothetical protein